MSTRKLRKSTYRCTWFSFMGAAQGDPVKGRRGMEGEGVFQVKTRVCYLSSSISETWTHLIGTRENNITALLGAKSKGALKLQVAKHLDFSYHICKTGLVLHASTCIIQDYFKEKHDPV